MTQRIEQIFRTRDLLDNPHLHKPSFHQLLRGELSCEQDLANELNNTGKPWTVATYQLNYTPGQSSYTINVTDMGKVLFVVRQTNNSYIPYLPVPFSDLNEQHYGTLWGNFYNIYSGWGGYVLSETIEQMAFYRTGLTNQTVEVQLQPAPQTSATYIITYLAGVINNDDPLETIIAIPEFATLTQLRNAMALLPYCQWTEDRKEDLERKKELAQAFAYQLERKERALAEYKSSLVVPKTVEIAGWNEGYGNYY